MKENGAIAASFWAGNYLEKMISADMQKKKTASDRFGGDRKMRQDARVRGAIHNTSKQRLWIAMRQPEGSLLGENPLIPLFSGAGRFRQI